jgi:biotin operon repressor
MEDLKKMRPKTKEMLNRLRTLLAENEYQSAAQLAEATHMSTASVYRAVRILKEEGTGILVTNKGYILSSCAKKRDDVNFLRRLNGRRTSDFISMTAAEPDMKKRWKSVIDRRTLALILAPLRADVVTLKKGLDQVVLLEQKKGIGKV